MKQYELMQPEHIIFALDIGTRSVIGILGEADGEKIRVIDVEMIEHSKRAMIDGQIEDIAQVALIARQVKEALEERNHMQLTRVSVAAAGRALKTHRVSKVMPMDTSITITAAKVAELESKTLEQANLEMFADQEAMVQSQFYCVGYSVMKYYLDSYPISTLVGHRGQQVQIDMLVTFLPNAVVESLYATMSSIQLEIESLTLEPIAAMNLVIPAELRNLNLALVDIGAGTSDIAISREGSVVAYAMATIAGDELTEAISSAHLVDFHEAERIKHALSSKQAITFTDILGMEYELSYDEVFEHVKPALNNLCTIITEKIMDANSIPPAAVFLVGGASKIPTIADLVSEKLNMDIRKVAVGGSLSIRKQIVSEHDVFHPEYVTPLGIVLTALRAKGTDGLAVTINGKRSHMMIKRSTSVIDILLASGYQYQEMIASSGKNIIYTWNGQNKIVRGTYAKPAQILVNDKPVNVFTQVKGGDSITFIPSIPGQDAKAMLSQLVVQQPFEVRFNGKRCFAGPLVHVNDILVSMDYEIQQGDAVKTIDIISLEDLCRYGKIQSEHLHFFVEGNEVGLDYELKPNDQIESMTFLSTDRNDRGQAKELVYSSSFEIKQISNQFDQSDQHNQNFDSHETKLVNQINQVESTSLDNESIQNIQRITVTLNGRPTLLPSNDTAYVFLDMLNFINIDMKQVKGDVILRLNGKDASYLDPIANGDDIVITWSE